ncbi:MAG: hypothetical protein HQK51_06555 [Oligoflexia bacterium]|nr:hypothetical protein [Oligoflexia bacterium]
MKRIIFLVLWLFVFGLNYSFAGERDTHGGAYVFCPGWDGSRTEAGTPTSFDDPYVALLDLWEGETFNGYKYPLHDFASIDEILNRIEKYVDKDFFEKLKYYVHKVNSVISDVGYSQNLDILPPTDTKNGFIKKGCKVEGVALFQSSPSHFGTLYIDMPTYHSVNTLYATRNLPQRPFNQRALIFHEAIYKMLRDDTGVTNSVVARQITANLLATTAPKRFFSKPSYVCADKYGENSFYIIESSSNKETYVWLINGRSEAVHPQTYLKFDLSFEEFMQKMPELKFPLTGRPLGSDLTYIYRKNGNNSGYELQSRGSFELVKCHKNSINK